MSARRDELLDLLRLLKEDEGSYVPALAAKLRDTDRPVSALLDEAQRNGWVLVRATGPYATRTCFLTRAGAEARGDR